MIEIFKTNVTDKHEAARLISMIHERFSNYRANFDLSDCDRILRIKGENGCIDSYKLISFLEEQGVSAETLPDAPPGVRPMTHRLAIRSLIMPQY
jgi:hypothetical protein